MEKDNNFQYDYSAKEQEEIKKIRSRYLPREESKLEKLRRLDADVTKKATAWSVSAGVAGTLLMGSGMSLCMVAGGFWMVPGIIIGLIGCGGIGAAYPVYNRILEREKAKAAPEILRLTEELIK